MIQQTVIPATGMDEPTFASFHAGSNSPLVEALQAIARGDSPGAVIFFWGPPGAGKSHLLQACCHRAVEVGRPYRYLTAEDSHQFSARGSSRQEYQSGVLICLDDLGKGLAGTAEELHWLSLYELIRQGGGNLVVAAEKPPAEIGLETPDLSSRLSAGGVFHLSPVDDPEKRKILSDRAHQRGFELPEAVIEYIMRHYARDTGSLFALLDRLDHASLSQHRRITIPFLRDLQAR